MNSIKLKLDPKMATGFVVVVVAIVVARAVALFVALVVALAFR